VVAKPTGPGGLPLPRTDNSVTWAITDDNKAIADGKPAEGGPLKVYNYADYVDPVTVKKFQKQTGAKVQIATYNSAEEAIAKLAGGAVTFDVIIGLTGSNIVDLIAHNAVDGRSTTRTCRTSRTSGWSWPIRSTTAAPASPCPTWVE